MTTSTPRSVNTKTAPRRDIYYRTIDELWADLDAIESAIGACTISHTGNWTPGENMEHVARFISFSFDGFPMKMPAPVRWIARALLLPKIRKDDRPMPSGQMPTAKQMMPTPGITDAEGLAKLRDQVERIRGGEQMTVPSPFLGKLTHEEWVDLHRKHASMHLSFIKV